MLIKSSDDRTGDIDTLNQLKSNQSLAHDVRKKVEQELKFMLSGLKGERDAAYEINFYFEATQNWAVIHDLRLEYEGRVAQIDHLLIDRFLTIYVCESKRFCEGISINEYGECVTYREGKVYGMPSPFEQNNKHVAVLKAVCDAGVIMLPKRLGITLKPDFTSLVLVSKNARIGRPKAKILGIENIIKVDNIKTHLMKEIDSPNPFLLAKAISVETLESLAKQVAALHRPIKIDWQAKFGLSETPVQSNANAVPVTVALPEEAKISTRHEHEKPTSKLACLNCDQIVSYNVAKFCWNNKGRFGGNVYCMDCQKNVSIEKKG